MGKTVTEATKENFDAICEKGAVLVKFWIDNCPFCEVMDPVFDRYQAEHPEITCVSYKTTKEGDEVTKSLGVKSFPSFVGLIDGDPVQELVTKVLVGVKPASKLSDAFKTDLPLIDREAKVETQELSSVRDLSMTALNFLKRDIEAVICERENGVNCGELWCDHIKVSKTCYVDGSDKKSN